MQLPQATPTRLGTLLVLLGLVACSSDNNEQSPPAIAGMPATTAGAPAVAGSTASSGGSTTSAGSTASSGGSTASAGSTASSGGSSGSGGTLPTDGGTFGSGGSVPNAGSAGTSAGSPGIELGIPAGYPAPSAENAAKCKTVAMQGGFCPGGGSGPICVQCLFGGDAFGQSETTPTAEGTALAGNYVVSVKLTGTSTFVSAESSRALLPASAAGDFAFVVNVRAMEGQPRHAGGPSGYPGLDLFFSGTSATPPLISAVGYELAKPATKPIMVYIAGDSTVCDQTGNSFAGWGQMLPQHFAPPVGIANYANSGASSGGFGFWKDITSRWSAGDWVIIQFGHNDKGVSDAVVQANLERYAGDALAANVTPIIVSPPARAQYTGAKLDSQTGLHAAAAKAAAAAKKVAYIDLTALSSDWYNTLGSQAAALKFHPGTDVTHTNLAGANKLAELVAAEIKTQNLGLAKYLRK